MTASVPSAILEPLMDARISTNHGRLAIVAALAAFTTESDGHRPWMPAVALAQVVGADSAADPQFDADVQALSNAGTVRLMAFGGTNDSGASFLEVMLAPPSGPLDAPLEAPVD